MTNAAASPVVHARAPGKINVFLKVGAVLEDGYHEVATAYQAVSLSEDVRAYPADDFSVTFGGSIDTSGLAVDGSNLAIRAAQALARKSGFRGGVRLEIEKNVPIAGGMGGGSADAAATLLACDTLWGTEATRDDLLAIAATLGADVPFAFTGGTAIGTGRGDQLSPALAKGQFHWVFALADFGLSTPAVYNELDRHRERHAQDIFPAQIQPTVDANVLQALRAGDPRMLAEALHNDLQAPALHLAPGLGKVLELGEENGALAGILSGSGPTVAFLVADADNALELQVALSASRLRVVRATGPVHGARVIHD
ncbi:4-(cytidine 5'-diphospho)-2-C-methyl-D-erythritol kinase [Cryobacterium sp. TMT1-21]|uniref:4-diphosphocytidyl-2-C-methyl-D-erythritol kinase n=1 Tax=Cryobacterium shii TaxID=1259235 RepID=A0AAQ2C452_9MICO|nr:MULTISPECIES: 4-(cytidine 5'-diphospho)-2-C-methyl-D-erythritol kinase [Cryobacterium]TFC42570.1 4-(cytidine 5'-diphospho)-2-C-methyl-D-erythritol kinase [Cryobacterium shii]TFC80902.1 4-(cytidine 5'-diphospho)-2-C-methyl-D-erythritol kinase [Cryobacterium sp. TmT2-59]TFD15570.1 4-(cytidine 5'-diphospho)-2-C-methyl-D-erythritol kinase [Cryobacterium sp. TMT1-21]TFD18592.1 4-(cytidine 5'-diphospho)-2-C-methyl-D-erythritol kinase [Cryobacterium sp. TMT4-10]TFD28393.1 4-(cytidine 5'-diphospho)